MIIVTYLLCAAGLLALYGMACDGRRWLRDGESRAANLPPSPSPEPILPLSDAMRDAIRRDVSAAIDRDARTAWACRVMAFHASGHGVRKATVDELMPCVVEVDR